MVDQGLDGGTLTRKEVAYLLGVSCRTVDRIKRAGRLAFTAARGGVRHVRFERSAVDAYAKELETRGRCGLAT